MSILKVAMMGHPILRTKARPIPQHEIGSPQVQQHEVRVVFRVLNDQ